MPGDHLVTVVLYWGVVGLGVVGLGVALVRWFFHWLFRDY